MKKYFKIVGYWKDTQESFSDYLVAEDYEENEEINDDAVFFYGLSEDDIKQEIALGTEGSLEFVIIEYEKL